MNELFMYDLLKIHVHLIRIQCFEVYISGLALINWPWEILATFLK